MRHATTMQPAAAGNQAPRHAAAFGSRLRLLWLGMLMAVLSTLAVTAWAQPMTPGMGGEMDGMRHHHGMGGGMMGGGMMGGRPEMMGRMIDHMLDGLNATDAQRGQIKQIAEAAAADLRAQREAGRGLHERGLQIFTAPTIDAAAAESLRQQMLARHDQASKRMTQAMLDIGRVLTPEQRAKIGERMKERGARMRERMERMQRERPDAPRPPPSR